MKTIRGKYILVCLAACALVLLSACGGKKPAVTDTSGTGEISESETAATTQKPTPMPTPTPAPEMLFAKDLYAVLPGEGAYHYIYDCYGNPVQSFLFTDRETTDPMIGLYTEAELSSYFKVNKAQVQTAVPENKEEWNNILESFENGFYQISRGETANTVYIYNNEGILVRTLEYALHADPSNGYLMTSVVYADGETVVLFFGDSWDPETQASSYYAAVYFLAPDGSVNDRYEANNIPAEISGILGRKYFLVGSGGRHEEGIFYVENCDLYDFSGSLVMEDTAQMAEGPDIIWIGDSSFYLSNYYLKDGQLYDSSFQPVVKNTVGAGGDLIYGVEYDVQGITCTCAYKTNLLYSPSELVAIGKKDELIAIKTKDAEYVLDSENMEYYALTDKAVLLADWNQGIILVKSLETGELLNTIDEKEWLSASGKWGYVWATDDYILVGTGETDPVSGRYCGFYVIDKDNKIRFVTHHAYIGCMSGEYIVLYRGPYVGIADLDGNWIMKTLSWAMTRDTEYVYQWGYAFPVYHGE